MQSVSYRTILRYYWMQIRKNRWLFVLPFIVYGIGTTLEDVIRPIVIRRIIDVISNSPQLSSSGSELVFLMIVMGVLMVLWKTLFRIGDFSVSNFQSRTMKNLSDFAFSELTSHSYKFFANSFAGSLVTKVKRFVRSFEDASDQVYFSFWQTIVQVLGVMVSLFIFAPQLAWMVLIWMVFYLFLAFYLTKKKMPYDLTESTTDSKVTGRLADVITNVLNLKMFSSRNKEVRSYGIVTEQERVARLNAWNFGNYTNLVQSVLFGIIEFTGLSFALYLWYHDRLSAGTIVLFQFYIAAMGHNLWNIGKSMGKVSKNFADASELVEIFERPIDIKDPAHPEPLRIMSGTINLRDISFRYGKDNALVFSDFTLAIPTGQRVGIVGHSGAGKSTITKLLLRFADVNEGAITIDGQDIRHIKQDDLRSVISYVPQDPILFHRSLRENIAYGRPDATEQEIIEASKKAHAHEFIEGFPQGYDTLVGERGIKLSGGERQRVAIARAMLKDAPILILDEATSSLDSVSEDFIQEAFKELMRGRTTLVIAHRLSTIQKLDRIVVLENGRIVEDGTHTDLLAKHGVYYNFWEHQTAGFIE